MTPTSPHTELDRSLPLNLTRLRRGATLGWKDTRGPQSFPLAGKVVLGAAEGVKVPLADPRVSRLHAELELDDGGVWLRDLGSSNGTWVDGLRVERVRFEQSGHFRVGATELTITFSEPAKVALWPEDRLGALLGRSEPMRELFMQLTRVAGSDAAVSIHGETGTGKELVASELHAASRRSAKPFVVVDCASLPENLLEAELFGHARGAFTGAVAARVGSIEAAEGGTVFLDEVGELPLAMQPKLLRVLESKTVRRVGETAQTPVDVRFVSATHRDLEAMVAQGQFREDLFFRLTVLPLQVPPLRERADDLPLLLGHFLKDGPALDDATLATLRAHRWPGNVRELKSFAERVSALGLDRALGMLKGVDAAPPAVAAPAGDNPLAVDPSVPFKVLRERWTDHLEREYVRALISKVGRNAGAIADAAGLDRSYVNRLLRKHEL
ncbi:MAG: sigma 54-interacting transcriptional regulator [Archangium sp.]|nr:sigma 54-interacting transcriptional regulator [Archangium sp.]